MRRTYILEKQNSAQTRLEVPIMESGDGNSQPYPRPFMNEARDEYVDSGKAERDLIAALESAGLLLEHSFDVPIIVGMRELEAYIRLLSRLGGAMSALLAAAVENGGKTPTLTERQPAVTFCESGRSKLRIVPIHKTLSFLIHYISL